MKNNHGYETLWKNKTYAKLTVLQEMGKQQAWST
jgi:hypothetical protein